MKQTTYKSPVLEDPYEKESGLFKPEILFKNQYLQIGYLKIELERIVGTFDEFKVLSLEDVPVAFLDGNPAWGVLSNCSVMRGYQGKGELEVKKYWKAIIALGGENASANLIVRVQKCPAVTEIPLFKWEDIDEFYTNNVIAIAANTCVERALTQYFLDKDWERR